ncbi:hypothetical protein [Streptomyces sp. DH41]|uniref:hypothetical protein n=1 Tax=Streptomyces sp. DH41 TaxID=3040125 RepID=UPI002441DA1B|nr:hypothetical protein [Streptomyces sp. DH41]MDG9724368.1 hypothetical protein [Streptomyces sp. DH41]
MTTSREGLPWGTAAAAYQVMGDNVTSDRSCEGPRPGMERCGDERSMPAVMISMSLTAGDHRTFARTPEPSLLQLGCVARGNGQNLVSSEPMPDCLPLPGPRGTARGPDSLAAPTETTDLENTA